MPLEVELTEAESTSRDVEVVTLHSVELDSMLQSRAALTSLSRSLQYQFLQNFGQSLKYTGFDSHSTVQQVSHETKVL